MKIVDDDGNLIEELPADAAILVFRREGAEIYMPKLEDDQKVPDHVVMCAHTAVYISDLDNQKEITAYIDMRTSGAH